MTAYNAREVTDCYDQTAQEYAEKYLNELEGKPAGRPPAEKARGR